MSQIALNSSSDKVGSSKMLWAGPFSDIVDNRLDSVARRECPASGAGVVGDDSSGAAVLAVSSITEQSCNIMSNELSAWKDALLGDVVRAITGSGPSDGASGGGRLYVSLLVPTVETVGLISCCRVEAGLVDC